MDENIYIEIKTVRRQKNRNDKIAFSDKNTELNLNG